MVSQRVSLLAVAVLSLAALLLGGSAARAQRGHYGVRIGIYPGGYYRPYGYYPYGYYRPYPVVGVGIGLGLYAPYYGSYAYPLAPGVVYQPYPVVVGSSLPP